MTAANQKFGGLTAGQVRDIYRNKTGRSIAAMAKFYGVSEEIIKDVRRYQSRRANPGHHGRISLVNA